MLSCFNLLWPEPGAERADVVSARDQLHPVPGLAQRGETGGTHRQGHLHLGHPHSRRHARRHPGGRAD